MLRLPVLYKHENLRYIRSLHFLNQIRIGTLYDFRCEEHGKGITDALEGVSTIRTHVNRSGMLSGQDLRGTLPELLGGIYVDDTSSIELNNCTFSSEFSFPNCHILCFSRSNSDSARVSSGREASMFVLDVKVLCRLVGNFLGKHYECDFRIISGECHYIPRIQELDWRSRDMGVSPLFIKGDDAKFVDQAEYRVAFLPKDTELTLKPIIATVPRVSDVFSLPNEVSDGGL